MNHDFFRCLIRFALSRSMRLSTAALSTVTSLRVSASNLPNPLGFLLAAMLATPLREAHESGIVYAGQLTICETFADRTLDHGLESAAVARLAAVESEGLLHAHAGRMEPLHTYAAVP